MNRPSLGYLPPSNWIDILEKGNDNYLRTNFFILGYLSVHPADLDQVFTAGCGSCAVETAFKGI